MLHTPTESQRKAIEAELGPLLVLAGPGSGKTFCLTQRVRRLIEFHGIAAERICAFTFTNKAADEIASRLETLGPAARAVKRCTIHKFCVDVLREFGGAVGVDPAFGIADEEYQTTLLRQVGSSERNHRSLLQSFARHRLRGDTLTTGDARRFERYQQLLHDRNMLDFDQLLLRAADVIRHAPAADALRRRYDALLVDEFQDLNPVQYAIVRAIASEARNVFAVGDCDQSIYGWAGADVTLFRTFVNDFAIGREPVRLTENHRTARQIFSLAQTFAEGIPIFPELGGRAAIVATRETEHPVEARQFESDSDEIAWLIRDMREQRERYGLSWGDFGLLYRRHEIGNVLEPALLIAGVPCRLAHGRAVAEDPVVRYVTACFGVMLHPGDAAYQEQFLKLVLPRTMIAAAKAEAERRGSTIFSWLREQTEKVNPKMDTADKIKRARAALKSLGAYVRRHSDLGSLLEELLARRVGQFRTQLEERHRELDDPEVNTHATALAFRISSALQRQARVTVERQGGAEIPIKAMLHALGLRSVVIPSEARDPHSGVIPSEARDLHSVVIPSEARDLHSGVIPSEARDLHSGYVQAPRVARGDTLRDVHSGHVQAPRVARGDTLRDVHSGYVQAPRVARGDNAADHFSQADSPSAPLALTVFKAAQIITARHFESTFRDFTAIDIETTGLDTRRCEIIEIAAVRVRDGRPVAEFQSLVKPTIPIEPGASAVHGIGELEVAQAPGFAEVWRAFQEFCGDDVLVAHNGEDFDFPVLRRQARGMIGAATMATYDSMPLAYEITPASHQLKALALEYGIDPGNSHRALDDARTLAHVFTRLNHEKVTRSRKSCCVNLLDHLGVALALSKPLPETGDARILLEIGTPFALGVFSEALSYYEVMSKEPGAGDIATVENVIAALGGVEVMDRIRRAKSAEERYPTSMQRLRLLSAGTASAPLKEQMETLLERVALSGREADTDERGRANLLTLHATKGLEFSRVYLVGAEDAQFAVDNASKEEIDESRRVFYVGMTRARDRLVMTRSLLRNGKPTGGAAYLDELGLGAVSREDARMPHLRENAAAPAL